MAKGSIRRSRGNKKSKSKVQILTEGKATEIEYLRHLCESWNLPKELVAIDKSTHTDVKGIVKEIVAMKTENERKARKGEETRIDQWWVICDTEGEQKELKSAILEAQNNGVFIAFSDLSIEFWLRLHFGYTTRQYNSVSEIIKDLNAQGLSDYSEDNKHPDMSVLFPLLDEAMKNARLVRQNYATKGELQPLTDIDLTIDALLEITTNVDISFEQIPFNSNNLSMNALINAT